EAGNISHMRYLRIDAEDCPRIAFTVDEVAREHLARRQILEDPSPLRGDLDASLSDQALEVIQLRRTRMGLDIVGHEVIIFEQKAKFGMLVGKADGLGDDAIAAGQALLARAAPEKVEV